MEVSRLDSLAMLRIVVGYLGEREQYAWWESSFFGVGSKAFLAPVFGRTQLLAQCTGVTRAAALIHDERIGVGNVYHLFRLPEDMEQSIHRVLHDPDMVARANTVIGSRATAFAHLRTMYTPRENESIGPTRIGSVHFLRKDDVWTAVAGHYGHAFDHQSPIYPYFSDAPSIT